MALSKNNTKGNGVLLQNIVLKKNHAKEKGMGRYTSTYSKALWYMILAKPAGLSHF